MTSSEHDTVLIIDAGSQYCKLIDRIIRELNVRTEVCGLNITSAEILKKGYRAIVISGGPGSVAEDDECAESESLNFDETILDIGLPILGICYGMQLIVKLHGGKIKRACAVENSCTEIEIVEKCDLYTGIPDKFQVLLTHADSVTEIGGFFKINAKTSEGTIAAISNDQVRIYGTQFHPEVDLTTEGKKIFFNFIFNISKCSPTFNQQNKLEKCMDILKNIPPHINICVLVSGGVDSTLCAVLVNKLLTNHNKYFILIDNGLLRQNEALTVKNNLKTLGIDIIIVEASEIFLNSTTFVKLSPDSHILNEIGPLRIQCLPENKRMIIGDTFISVVKECLQNLGLGFKIGENDTVLIQGSLRPDLIESGSETVSKNAHTIKTHHNDSGAVRVLRNAGKIVEPLMDFHKDEVKQFAKMLEIPEHFMNRKPFPGPGLAVRILCSEKPKTYGSDDRFDIPILAGILANYYQRSKDSDGPVYKYIKESLSSLEYEKLLEVTNVSYTFASTLLPILSVGIQGDTRTYRNGIALSTNAEKIDWEKLFFIAKIIPKICTSINRVMFAFGPPIAFPVQSITLTFLSPESISLCRTAHAIVDNILEKNVPPMRRSLVLRPFITRDFMTGVPAIPNKDISEEVVNLMRDELQQLPMISRILYDLTPKPPGTTEWE